MKYNYYEEPTDQGAESAVIPIPHMAVKNNNFRTAVWTGCNLQMTVMSIPPCGDIGIEKHDNVDQMIRVESGKGVAMTGSNPHDLNDKWIMEEGDALFVPAGTWHNVKNAARYPLKVSSVYAPPQHPKGTVDKVKK